jgi:hypothetical protein
VYDYYHDAVVCGRQVRCARHAWRGGDCCALIHPRDQSRRSAALAAPCPVLTHCSPLEMHSSRPISSTGRLTSRRSRIALFAWIGDHNPLSEGTARTCPHIWVHSRASAQPDRPQPRMRMHSARGTRRTARSARGPALDLRHYYPVPAAVRADGFTGRASFHPPAPGPGPYPARPAPAPRGRSYVLGLKTTSSFVCFWRMGGMTLCGAWRLRRADFGVRARAAALPRRPPPRPRRRGGSVQGEYG